MTYTLRILPAADIDLDEAALYVAQDSVEQAQRLYDAADATFRLIREYQARGPQCQFDHPRLRSVRRCAIVGFRNHLVFYRVEPNIVEVIRILHGARDILSILSDLVGDDVR